MKRAFKFKITLRSDHGLVHYNTTATNIDKAIEYALETTGAPEQAIKEIVVEEIGLTENKKELT